jgi:phosphoglycolate phosphatase-like HAD superfamily hydrolase
MTAANAGMVSVAVTWGYQDRDHLIAGQPDHTIDNPAQLIALV